LGSALVDCHTHLDQYPPGELDEVLARAQEAGVHAIVVAGTTVASSARCLALAEGHAALFAGVGIHPMEVQGPFDEEAYARLRDMARSSPRVVAVSEVGLDFSPGTPDMALQYPAFRQQVRLARELGLPIIFHSREIPGDPEAHREALRVLREERGWEVGGIMHYFQATWEIAQEALDLGFLISLGKPLLRLSHLQEVAVRLPLEGVVLETDAAPQPFKAKRSNWTEPKDTRLVAERLALLRGVSLEAVARTTTANLLGLYDRIGATRVRGLLGHALGAPSQPA
jgi:TatD DNase family protein